MGKSPRMQLLRTLVLSLLCIKIRADGGIQKGQLITKKYKLKNVLISYLLKLSLTITENLKGVALFYPVEIVPILVYNSSAIKNSLKQ